MLLARDNSRQGNCKKKEIFISCSISVLQVGKHCVVKGQFTEDVDCSKGERKKSCEEPEKQIDGVVSMMSDTQEKEPLIKFSIKETFVSVHHFKEEKCFGFDFPNPWEVNALIHCHISWSCLSSCVT